MLGVATMCGTVLWFALLAQRPLFDPDEGRYAEIPREMLSGGDWLIPHLNGLAYLEKPPLQYWLTALAFRGLGQGEFAARLTTGAAGFLTLGLVYFLGRRLWGTDAGVRALLFTLASVLFVLLGHQLTLDMLLSFCLTAALGSFLLAQAADVAPRQRRAWMLACWMGMALAVLAKGLIGVLIPAATLFGYMLWQRACRLLRRLNLRWGLPLFGAVALPWFALAARADPRFLGFFFVREHFQRFLTPIEHRTQPWWFFLPVLAVGIMPWLPQAARALLSPFMDGAQRGSCEARGPSEAGGRSDAGRPFDARRVLWIWCVFVLVFFSASDSKLIPYILPAVPALALLCAGRGAADSRRSLWTGALLSLGSGMGVLAYASGRWNSPEGRELLLLAGPVLLGTCALLCLGAVFCAVFAVRRRPRAALTSLCLAWFAASCSILVAAQAAQSLFSAKDAARALLARGAAPGDVGPPVYSVQSYQQSLPFYLRREVILVDYRDEFDLGLREDPQRGIATLLLFSRVWQAEDGGFAVMAPRTLDRLRTMGVPMHEFARFADRVMVDRRE
jgi:4-amino-4-deoxy-L-arabinose transferase-like glycosyltransferase